MFITELKEAGRYEEVVSLLEKISNDNQQMYAVDAYTDNKGDTLFSVDGEAVRSEARLLLEYLKGDDNVDNRKKNHQFLNLYQHLCSETNRMLHNFTVALTHRKIPVIDLDKIRVYEVANNLAICYDGLDDDSWTIPEGWKKK